MNINIPKNTYKKPVEIRENVVQSICDFFLLNIQWQENYFYYFDPKINKLVEFSVKQKENNKLLVPTENEMKTAFKLLINAGYFLFEKYVDNFGYVYVCSEKDFYKDLYNKLWTQTTEFKVRLD